MHLPARSFLLYIIFSEITRTSSNHGNNKQRSIEDDPEVVIKSSDDDISEPEHEPLVEVDPQRFARKLLLLFVNGLKSLELIAVCKTNTNQHSTLGIQIA